MRVCAQKIEKLASKTCKSSGDHTEDKMEEYPDKHGKQKADNLIIRCAAGKKPD